MSTESELDAAAFYGGRVESVSYLVYYQEIPTAWRSMGEHTAAAAAATAMDLLGRGRYGVHVLQLVHLETHESSPWTSRISRWLTAEEMATLAKDVAEGEPEY